MPLHSVLLPSIDTLKLRGAALNPSPQVCIQQEADDGKAEEYEGGRKCDEKEDGPQDATRNGGHVGAFLGYAVVGTVVYCLCVPVREIIAFLPNVGGAVGLADLFALADSMSVLVSALVGLLTFLSYGAGSANTVFNWLANVASVASLQSWAGMLFTYIRWHQGTVHYERKWRGDDSLEGREAMAQIEKIKKNRSWGQPYLAWYALALCLLVLFTNGWAVFVNNGWRIADTFGAAPLDTDVVSQFLSAYVPLPFFLLLTFGYKLIKQTEMIPLEKMTFYQGQLPPYNPEDNEPKGWLEKLLAWLLLI
ncbi:transporter [Ganoderma sinense ZZ0214-1]|uniref:Transporter n=1 Tax=Ganoderma sinense ZZ0214-1 TaxID=1077348 RepID=A0A2G8SM60_9APHY|nr:transporter [Ganoderma sinense ZZ0214-1]